MILKDFKQLRQLVESVDKRTVAVVAAHDAHTLEAVLKTKDEGILDHILIGKKDEIIKIGNELGYDVSPDVIIDSDTDEDAVAKGQYKLDNLIVFIDHNGYQQDGMTSEIMNFSFADTLGAIGCKVVEIDGNDTEAIINALENRPINGKPLVIVGHTIKGKGVSFMEGVNSWHHSSMNEDQYKQAMEELK